MPNFFAAGEEKTIMKLPTGYGYPYRASDNWLLNYMIHDLTPGPYQVWITYDIDFVPTTSPAAQQITPARPIWMDVQNGSIYPVFDVIKGAGTNGTFTYPDHANDPYGGGRQKNVVPSTATACCSARPATCTPAACTTICAWTGRARPAPGSSVVAGTPDTAHLFRRWPTTSSRPARSAGTSR